MPRSRITVSVATTFREPGVTLRQGWSDAEWDARVRSREEGTFFHTRAWARLCLVSFPNLRDASFWLETPDGSVLFPLFDWRRIGGLLVTRQSSFPFLYGGPIPNHDPQGAPVLPVVLHWLRSGRASVRITGNPFAQDLPRDHGGSGETTPAGEGRPEVGDPAGYRRRGDTTHWMILPSSEQAYWDALPAGKRNDVRRLGKKGVRVEESRSLEEARRIYRFYLSSFPHWGGRPGMVYPERFFLNLLSLGGDAVQLLVARHEDRLLGGAFFIRWNGTVHYLAGYFDRNARPFRPNVLIQIESILSAIRDRFERYDFLPSRGSKAVETFKESFGGRRAPFPILERTGPLHRFAGALRKGGNAG